MLARQFSDHTNLDDEQLRAERYHAHELARSASVKAYCREMLKKCEAYLRLRAAALAEGRESHHASAHWYSSFRTILTNVPLPFSGRLRNVTDLINVFAGGGSVRESQATVWRAICFVLIPDLLCTLQQFDIHGVISDSGLDAEYCKDLVAHARYHNTTNPLTHREVLCPPNDAIKHWQREARAKLPNLTATSRCWSAQTRASFLEESGEFSAVECALQSPRGPSFVPWMDACRLIDLRPTSVFVRTANELGVPVLTGPSNTAADMRKFTKILQCYEPNVLFETALAYLVPTRMHTFYEIEFSLRTWAGTNE